MPNKSSFIARMAMMAMLSIAIIYGISKLENERKLGAVILDSYEKKE